MIAASWGGWWTKPGWFWSEGVVREKGRKGGFGFGLTEVKMGVGSG